jgi:predicted dehydrogenase
MSEKRMGVGIIGCGGFSTGNHIPNTHHNPKLEMVALCDLNTEHLEKLSQQYSPRYVTTEMEKVFADPAIGMVICGTKPDFRIPIMELAVKHNKPLFVEKPLCLEEAEVEGMVKLMRGSGVPFMVGFNRPYSPMMQDIKALYQAHAKGPTTITYRIVGEGFIWPRHHFDAVYGRKESTLLHETTHIFDLLNWLTGLHPTRVYTIGGGHVDNIISLSYPDEVSAVIIAGDNGTTGYPKERIEIDTAFGTISGKNFIELWAAWKGEDLTNKFYDYKVGCEPFRTPAHEADAKKWDWRSAVTEEERKVGYYYGKMLKVNKGHYEEIEYFRQCVEAKRMPETDVVQGAVANIVAWRAMDSWRTGQPVDLDFSKFTK